MVEEDVLTKKGADLFKELLRVYSVADLEDYFKAGIWKDEIMKADLQLIVAHRREAGAPDPPDLEDVVMPEIPKTLLGGGILGVRPVVPMGLLAGLTRPAGPTALLATSPARPGGLLAGTMPGVVRPGIAGPLAASLAGMRPAVVAAGVAPGAAAVQAAGVAPTTGPAAKLKLIPLFIAKWKLDPTRTKMMLAKMTPAKRRFVITHFTNTASAADPTGALEQYISQCVSSVLKQSAMLLDLGVGARVLDDEGSDWWAVCDASIATRQPPLTPADMEIELEQKHFTKGAVDTNLVKRKYREFFSEATESAEKLLLANFSTGEGWGDAEVTQLARALPAFTRCKILSMWGHRALGERGLAELRAVLPQCRALRELWLPRHLRNTAEGEVKEASTSRRQPPLTPGDMGIELAQKQFTKGAVDTDLVKRKYREFFSEAATSAEELLFRNLSTGNGWGDAEVIQRARALPSFTRCRVLRLYGHRAMGERGLAELRGVLPQCPALRMLVLPAHLRGTAEGQALTQAAGAIWVRWV